MEVRSGRYRKILGEDFKSSTDLTINTIRTNTLKISPNVLRNRLEEQNYELEQIPWIREGFWVKLGDNLSKTIEHILGYFSMQDASSMIPPLVLNPKEGDIVLDLSAAPGSKTTQMANMMNNAGVIVANDIKHDRLKALRGNLQRCGVMNTIVTQQRGENFWRGEIKFNKILLDAPCTGTGTMNPRILKETSEKSIRHFSEVQKNILHSAVRCLEDGGTMVYSTCSLEPEENEFVVDFAVTELGMKIDKVGIDLPVTDFRDAITEWEGKSLDQSVSRSLRILPSQKKEGFFICKLTL
jgi:NOL1/NOP2/sun family putative RNA methylase